MSGNRAPAGIVGAPTPASGSSTTTGTTQLQWRQERLIEARGVLADIAHHPDTLVLLACRVVCGCSTDPVERADALGVMRLLDVRPPETASIALNGGVA